MRDTIIFAAPRAPHPLDTGAAIRVQRLATGLSGAFDVTFLTYRHHPDSPLHRTRAEFREVLGEMEVVMVPEVPALPGEAARRRGEFRSLFSADSWTWRHYRRPRFRDVAASIAREQDASLIHFDDPAVALPGKVPELINVLAAHNVEHRVIKGESAGASLRRKVVNAMEWRKVRREERSVWRSMDLCLAVSDVDAGAMRAAGARRVGICPVGTDPVERARLPRRAAGEPLEILFVGVGGYPPNARGVAWFVSNVMPRIQAETPAILNVVGRRPPMPVELPGVAYVGSVPELRPWYERAHLVVVPIFEGSGQRQKIVEAMAYGRPVVSTPVGAEGLPVNAGEHYVEASDPAAFAEAVVEVGLMCESPDGELARMLDAARGAIEYAFWPNVVGDLIERYQAEIAQARGVAAGRGAA
jgi:polysaccharide biosynthesis protein PslH